MLLSSKTIRVQQPIQAVWNAITDFQHLPHWDTALRSVMTLGNAGVGQRADLEYTHPHDPQKKLALFAFVTRYTMPSEFAFQYNHYGILWEIHYELTEDGNTTFICRSHHARGLIGLVVGLWQRNYWQEQERLLMLHLKEFLDNLSYA